MEKNDILNEANEALKRTLLVMNYDMKKTLTENVEVISEQSTEDQDIAALLYKGGHGSPGTRINDLRSGFSKIKNADQFKRVEKLLALYGKEKTIQELLRNELESDNDDFLKELKDMMAKVGVDISYKEDVSYYQYGASAASTSDVDTSTITVSYKPTTSTTTSTNTDDLSCVKLKASDGDVRDTYGGRKLARVYYPNSIVVFWEDKKVTQYVRLADKSPGAQTRKGTWKCNSQRNDVETTWETGEKTKNTTTKKSIPAITDKAILDKLDFSVQFPGDKKYVYAFLPNTTLTEAETRPGTWYAKNIATGKVFDISKNYPSTEKKLDAQFPDAKNPESYAPKDLNTTQPATTDTEKPQVDVSDIKGKGLEVKPVGSKIDPTQNISLEKPKKTNTVSKPDFSSGDLFGPVTRTDDNMEVKESLKKSLKKNLKVIKEQKENLMVETNIVTKRFNFIVEGKSYKTEKEQDNLVESVISEIGYLKSQGYTPQAINEGLFSMLGSLLGGTFSAAPQVFGEYIAAWLIKQLGVPKDSYIASSITALVGNLNISDYDRFFSDCRFASNKIADSLIEGYVLQLQQQKGLDTGATGFIVSALRNSVVDYFVEDKNSLIDILEDKIGEFLCPKLSKLTGVITDKTEDIKAKVAS